MKKNTQGGVLIIETKGAPFGELQAKQSTGGEWSFSLGGRNPEEVKINKCSTRSTWSYVLFYVFINKHQHQQRYMMMPPQAQTPLMWAPSVFHHNQLNPCHPQVLTRSIHSRSIACMERLIQTGTTHTKTLLPSSY